ncbi:hypothetical protein IVA86_01760 [Bradyrhizobium sp. 146]|uniref:hypothetical protein n=1 Tax=Bradyrhizobium sp. 146 TaxID=2782622 RepID=UPI001FFA4C73|nr:hypothetical protein [Bradyrhizobium sp. 146]MCK1700202.1 hypothetical protein [Bradyrhizobium sp. 146]
MLTPGAILGSFPDGMLWLIALTLGSSTDGDGTRFGMVRTNPSSAKQDMHDRGRPKTKNGARKACHFLL